MVRVAKKILIIDEAGFSRICSAILEKEGFETISTRDSKHVVLNSLYNEYGLIITSYPFAESILSAIRKMKIPTIVLSDCLDADLTRMMENSGEELFYCMIKPVDYTKFRNLVRQLMQRDLNIGCATPDSNALFGESVIAID